MFTIPDPERKLLTDYLDVLLHTVTEYNIAKTLCQVTLSTRMRELFPDEEPRMLGWAAFKLFRTWCGANGLSRPEYDYAAFTNSLRTG